MGWKNVKEHYRIEHTVHLRDGNLCIGSGYLPENVVVAPDGRLLKTSVAASATFRRYETDIDADPATFRRLLHEPDTFTGAIPVYSYVDGEIVTLACEVLGWPNVTHDGQLMYENTHFADRTACIEKAISDYSAGVSLTRRDIADAEAQLQSARNDLARYEGFVAALKALPDLAATADTHG